jgi:hypothetical protein
VSVLSLVFLIGQKRKKMSNKQSFLVNFKIVFAYLFFISLAFHLSVFPSWAKWMQNLNLWLSNLVYHAVFQGKQTLIWESDSLAMCIHILNCALISAIICFFLNKKLTILKAGLVYILAFLMLKYGINKVFTLQFYEPSEIINKTDFGKLDLDILFWSTMGKSKTYQIFMGISEVLAGILLFYNRTRFLGTLLSFGILTNVFFINLGFDINVKLLSFALILLSLNILFNYKDNLRMLIGMNQEFSCETPTELNFTNKKHYKTILISLISLEILWIYV